MELRHNHPIILRANIGYIPSYGWIRSELVFLVILHGGVLNNIFSVGLWVVERQNVVVCYIS